MTTHVSERDPVLKELFERLSQAELARKLTALEGAAPITRNGVYMWKEVPADRVRAVSDVTGIAMKRLRPDLYDSDWVPTTETVAGRRRLTLIQGGKAAEAPTPA